MLRASRLYFVYLYLKPGWFEVQELGSETCKFYSLMLKSIAVEQEAYGLLIFLLLLTVPG